MPVDNIVDTHLITIIIRRVFAQNGKFYPQLFLDGALYDVEKMSAQYEKITNDEGIDHSRNISTSRFCDACKFWSFVDRNFNYEDYACNGCHNILMITYSIDNIVILRVNDVCFHCIL